MPSALAALLSKLNKSNRGQLDAYCYAQMLKEIKGKDFLLNQEFAEAWIRAMGRIEYTEALPELRRIARLHSKNKQYREKFEVLSQAAQEVLPELEAVAKREATEKNLLRPSQPEADPKTLLRSVVTSPEPQAKQLLRASVSEPSEQND